MRELQYLATAKFDDFHEPARRRFTERAVEAEASVMGTGGRIAMGEGTAGERTPAERLERILEHLEKQCWARSWEPAACGHLGVDAWLEFRGPFRSQRRRIPRPRRLRLCISRGGPLPAPRW